MTQLALIGDGLLLGSTPLERTARQHARRHGLTWLRCEFERGLFGPVEVAVFRTAGGSIVRRTAEMLAQAVQGA